MLVSSPWYCERYSVTATALLFIRPRTIIDVTFRRGRAGAGAVQQAFTRIHAADENVADARRIGAPSPCGGRVERNRVFSRTCPTLAPARFFAGGNVFVLTL